MVRQTEQVLRGTGHRAEGEHAGASEQVSWGRQSNHVVHQERSRKRECKEMGQTGDSDNKEERIS